MTALELIEELQKLVDKYGDLPVEIPCYDDIEYDDVRGVFKYTYGQGSESEYHVIMITH